MRVEFSQKSKRSPLLAPSCSAPSPRYNGLALILSRAVTGEPIMQRVTVRVPASTSNLGPGFDCLGVALRLYNDVTVGRGGGARATPITRAAARAFFTATGIKSFPFRCTIRGHIPTSRGLGSSASVRLGMLHCLNALAGRPLGREQIFQLAARLEGHPDNAAPASYGGFNLVRNEQRQRFPVSARLQFVLLIPDFEIKTDDAREMLPAQISFADAVASCGNACAITGAFASKNYGKLRGAFHDHLHEPYRKPLIPFLGDVVAAATGAGALGGFLSGSGSTIAAVTLRSPEKIARAMLAAARASGARSIITSADNRGARIIRG